MSADGFHNFLAVFFVKKIQKKVSAYSAHTKIGELYGNYLCRST
jgi:hypothetical protein